MCRPPVIHLTRLDETFHHLPRLLEKQKAAGVAVQAACAISGQYMFLSESALCPAPAGSVSFSDVHIKSDWMVMLSDWMVMVMTNGNGDDNRVGKWQR